MRSLIRTTCIVMILAAAGAGAQWTQTSGPEGGSIRGLAGNSKGLLALLQNEDLYRYSTNDAEWKLLRRLPAYSLFSVGDTIIADGVGGMIRSLDGGDTWESVGSRGVIWTLDVIGSTMYAMDVGANVLRSTDGGTTWTSFANLSSDVQAVATDDSIALISIYGVPGMYRSTDNGATWKKSVEGFPKESTPWRLFHHNGAFYSAAISTEGYRSRGVYRSDDSGTTWYALNSGLPEADGRFPLVYDFYAHDADLSIATTDGVYRLGETGWRRTLADFATAGSIDGTGDFYVGTGSGVLRSDHDEWKRLTTNMRAGDVNDLLVSGETVLAAANDGVHRTTDAGVSWSGTLDGSTLLLARDGQTTFAIQSRSIDGGIRRSTDDGVTWTDADGDLPYPKSVTSIAVGAAGVYVGLHDVRQSDEGSGLVWRAGGVRRTTNGGASWESVSNGLPAHDTVPTPVLHLAAIDHALLAVTADGLYRSTNDGESWSGVTLSREETTTSALGVHNGDFLVAANRYVLRSSTLGATWRRVAPSDTFRAPIERFYSLGDQLVAREVNASPTASVYALDGDVWRTINHRLPEGVTPFSFASAGSRILLGTLGAGVWTGLIDGVSGIDNGGPPAGSETFIVPNPVVDRGLLSYRLKRAGDVRLIITNAAGIVIQTRELGEGVEGVNSVEVAVDGLEAGVYFYWIESNNDVQIGRMVKE